MLLWLKPHQCHDNIDHTKQTLHIYMLLLDNGSDQTSSIWIEMFCENITISWEPWSPCCWYSSISCRRDNWCFHSRTEIFKKLSTSSYIARSIYRIFSERRKRLFIDAFLTELCLKLVQRPMHWELCFLEGHVSYTSRVLYKDRRMKECFKTKIATE